MTTKTDDSIDIIIKSVCPFCKTSSTKLEIIEHKAFGDSGPDYIKVKCIKCLHISSGAGNKFSRTYGDGKIELEINSLFPDSESQQPRITDPDDYLLNALLNQCNSISTRASVMVINPVVLKQIITELQARL